ncbi:MAG: hypothetical protein ACYS67_12680 [Planctomycetota bacterium]
MKERSRKKSILMLAKTILLLAVVTICTNTIIAETQYEWKDDESIEVEITSPDDDTYVPINHTQSLSATASDPDCQRHKNDGDTEWSDWYPIDDEVTSGNDSNDYHMWWEVSGGGEIVDEAPHTMYGTSALYQAPDYEAGSDVRDVTVTAKADDFNRGDETPTNRGYGDSQQEDSITLKVWQVTVTVSQSGSVSGNNDTVGYGDPNKPYGDEGGDKLGWVEFNEPNGCVFDGHNTEPKGSVPSGIKDSSNNDIVDGFVWKQDMKGISRIKTTTSDPNWVTPYLENDSNWVPDNPGSSWYDGDCRHPNGSSGENVHEIFMLDGPGLRVGTGNNANIAAGWRTLERDKQYRSFVHYGGERVSNKCVWDHEFIIVEDSGKWKVNSHNP